MYKETAKLILYRSFGDHSILSELSKIFHDFDAKTAEDAELIERIYTQIKALLDLATSYGFDENLWHNYLTFLLLMNENSFSLVSEKSPVQDGSVHHFAKNDFRVVKRLFDLTFTRLKKHSASTASQRSAIIKPLPKRSACTTGMSPQWYNVSPAALRLPPMRRKSSKSSPPSIRSTVLGCLA